MNSKWGIAGLILITLLASHFATRWQLAERPAQSQDTANQTTSAERKILYWVAPMDPNYRRDQPGKSPMGMDLVPVYVETSPAQGEVSISPTVVNNLGVRTTQVVRGHLSSQVSTVGYLQYDEDHLIHIHPRVEGWIETLYPKTEGDPVAAGAPLFAIYSPTLVNAQEELRLSIQRNNPALRAAAKQRLLALHVSADDIRHIEKTGKVQQAIVIRAPQSGVLSSLAIREGMYVKPGMEIMAIGQLEHIWVIADVFENQAASVQVGDPVVMTLDYLPGTEWKARVDYIYPTLNEKTRTAQVRVRFENPDGVMKPGMFGRLQIATKATAETLLIPPQALIRTGSDTRVVMALGNGRFRSQSVKIGRVADDHVQLLSGLKEGDEIVISGQFLIDSESNKQADFQRMDATMDHDMHESMNHESMNHESMNHESMNHAEHHHD